LSRPYRPGIETTNGFSEIDIVLRIFSTIEAQGANGRFHVRDRDGAMTEIGAEPNRRAWADNCRLSLR